MPRVQLRTTLPLFKVISGFEIRIPVDGLIHKPEGFCSKSGHRYQPSLDQVDDIVIHTYSYAWTRSGVPNMRLVCHWLRLDGRNLTLCRKSPVSYFEHESNDFQNDIIRRAIHLSMDTQSRGIFISPTSVLLPCHIDAACIPPD
ncbi:uncharacterized protein BT62DRAFT_1008156 [Guyanagaster necrorhizus]|uniref:Uncharacterized protein n=1 Tax=Guyanagaster necrorhizus TaxID=856835 RepID=A0A9P7VPV8_9AGAR|nr:uncharacterized protein BT62DRAFT_1008156 [Guyanagaster necrorhizus MCA 3950]KAG7444505.1 hypothetical protein BT62DRAFT_1008156 [Guyanagaster necrorhizus MCA 3950]